MSRRRPAVAPIGIGCAVVLVLGVGCSTADTRRDDAIAAVDSAPTTAAIDPPVDTVGDAGTQFYCGDFGSEEPPTLLAIDVETAAPVWKMCSDSSIPMYIAGSADGATVLLEQDGRGGAELVAVDDAGAERWRRPTPMDGIVGATFLAAGPIAVVTTDAVEGIMASTGDVLWSHPVADGTPIGATGDLVIEVSGGPFALSTDVSTAAGSVTMRAVEPASGEQRWSRPVDLVDGPMPSQYSPTVGDEVIVIPDNDGSTTLLETATGSELRTGPGFVEASGALLYERDPATYQIAALIEPTSGARLDPPTGTPVVTMTFRGQVPGGLLVASDPPTGPAATLRLIDTTTGSVRWEIPHLAIIGGSDDHLVAATGPLLQILDVADGSVLAEYRAPTDLVTFTSAVSGDGLVIVAPEWRGGAPGNVGEEDFVQPDCEGGPTMLDVTIDGTRYIVTESTDATAFCVDEGGTKAIGFVPTTPTPDPREETTMISGHGVFQVIALPEDFPEVRAAVDNGDAPMSIARGIDADYLVLIEHVPGEPTAGTFFQSPVFGSRTFELFGPDGVLLARVPISEPAGPNGPLDGDAPTYEDFVACAAEYGVDIPLTQPGESPASTVPANPDNLRDAWSSCRDLMADYMRASDQGGSEFVENFMAQLDCVADAGFYPSLGQQPEDPNASMWAFDACGESMPGRIALVECLTQAGLVVSVDGRTTGGPHPPEQAIAAWAGCRDVYITWFVPGPFLLDDRVGPLDCAADSGWIPAVMDIRERLEEQAAAVIASCAESTG